MFKYNLLFTFETIEKIIQDISNFKKLITNIT